VSELNPLPDGWASANLFELCTPKQWKTISKQDLLPSGYTVYGANGVIGFYDEYTHEEPTLMITCRGASCGNIHVSGSFSYINGNAMTLDNLAVDACRIGYLKYFLINRGLADVITGTAQPQITQENLKIVHVDLAPYNEQNRIVEKLEELLSDLDNGVAELKAAQTKLTQYRQSLLKSAVEGSLTAEWRQQNPVTETGEQLLQRILTERRQRWEQQKLAEFKEKGKTPPKDWQKKYPEPVQPDTSELQELPDGWVWASVDQCVLETKGITDGPFGSNLKSSHYVGSGPRVIRLQNIGDGVFYDEKAHITDKHYETLIKHSIEADDVVVAMMGEVLPRSCIIPDGVAPGIVKADCARIRVNKELLSPYLLAGFLNSPSTRQRTKSLIKGIGRPRINLGHIRALAIPIAPQSEQKAMIDSLNAQFDETTNKALEIEISLKHIDAQRKNILKDAFSGKLVPQNPNDEPASVLLKKIETERLAQAKLPKPKRTKKKANNKASIMDTLFEVLKAKGDWMDAQEAFRACGVTDGTETDRIEELYAELRRLDKDKKLITERKGDFDMIKLKEE
jgi:type I restriction enzyme S subunit